MRETNIGRKCRNQVRPVKIKIKNSEIFINIGTVPRKKIIRLLGACI